MKKVGAGLEPAPLKNMKGKTKKWAQDTMNDIR